MDKVRIPSENILAIVIGVKNYDNPNLHTLEAAENNANDFKDLLRKRKYASQSLGGDINDMQGVPDNQIFKKTDGAVDYPALRGEIKKFITESVKKFNIDLIIFYYSGHGSFDIAEKKYYLAVKSTDETDLKGTALEMSEIGGFVTNEKKKAVFILDSCFSENAFGPIESKADFYIMASSRYNETTKYPLNAHNSLFTSAFIDTVNNGIDGAGESITFSEIFEEIKRKLENISTPQEIGKNQAGNIIFEKNNIKEIKPSFDLDAAITTIYNSFRLTAEVNIPISKTVFDNLPLNIATYLRNICQDKGLLDDSDFLQEFYYQIIHFLSFIFINDLTRSDVLNIEDQKFYKSWKKTQTSDNDINNFYIEIINRSCSKYKEHLFITELNNYSSLLKVISCLEKCFLPNRILPNDKIVDFRKYLFLLLPELKFLKNYVLLAVKFIEVKKSFFGKIIFEHKVSKLLGPDPGRYQTSPDLESENDFLNNAIILIPKITATAQLTNVIAEHKFLNLWPFMIDGSGNDEDAQNPTLCVFEDITEDVDKQYNYRPVQYKKEREQKREYSTLRVYPAKEEWDEFYNS
jgi:hypothetical protein